MFRAIDIAVGFLTIWSVKVEPPPDMEEVGRVSWAFPLVGAGLGMILLVVHLVLQSLLPVTLSAILVVTLWVVLTGGLHLDGWCDCWDALAAATTPERRYEILKDSRLGTFGALALLLLIAWKVAAIATESFPVTMLVLAPVLGRGIMVVAAYGVRHRGHGMATLFLRGLDEKTVQKTALIAFIPALLAGWTGLAAVGLALLGAMWLRQWADTRLQAVNGDVLGALCEFSEAIVLIVGCIRW